MKLKKQYLSWFNTIGKFSGKYGLVSLFDSLSKTWHEVTFSLCYWHGFLCCIDMLSDFNFVFRSSQLHQYLNFVTFLVFLRAIYLFCSICSIVLHSWMLLLFRKGSSWYFIFDRLWSSEVTGKSEKVFNVTILVFRALNKSCCDSYYARYEKERNKALRTKKELYME